MQARICSRFVFGSMILFILAVPGTAQWQYIAGSTIWINVYGDGNSKAVMHFGNHEGNTRGLDTSRTLGVFREAEPPPSPPGFAAVWGAITSTQFGSGVSSLLGNDFRALDSQATRDTFDLKFAQSDNASATISFKWESSDYLKLTADSLSMRVIAPQGSYYVDMMAVDTLALPAAGDSGFFKLRIIKYGSYLCGCDPLGTYDDDQAVPTRTLLLQNYPNPFNPATEIRFEVPVSGFVSLKVFDVLGREVATLVYEQKSPGSYTVQWDASSQANGVYYYRLATPNSVEVRKMMLIK